MNRASAWSILRAGAYAADLSDAHGTSALLATLAQHSLHVDVLINNAGRSIRRPISQAYERAHDYERTISLNYLGAVRLILGLLPAMRARRSGQIVNISSVAVPLGPPSFSAYVASKSALDAFARSAALETFADGVHWSTIHMPLVRTAMSAPTQDFAALPALSPEQAADVIIRALVTKDTRVGTLSSSLINLGHALAPGAMSHLFSWCERQTSTAAQNVSAPTQSRAAL